MNRAIAITMAIEKALSLEGRKAKMRAEHYFFISRMTWWRVLHGEGRTINPICADANFKN